MMIDQNKPRDLVALAAKAASGSDRLDWAPFDDPTDALELACDLSMTTDYTEDNNGTYVVTRARANGKHYCCVQPYRPETKLAMTMYAITYVAACIGEDMQDVPA